VRGCATWRRWYGSFCALIQRRCSTAGRIERSNGPCLVLKGLLTPQPMFPFRKILFPVDYSAPCGAVIPYIKDMARRFSASVTLVHAYAPHALAHSDLPITEPDYPSIGYAKKPCGERRT
jgi:hypothetical protein